MPLGTTTAVNILARIKNAILKQAARNEEIGLALIAPTPPINPTTSQPPSVSITTPNFTLTLTPSNSDQVLAQVIAAVNVYNTYK